MLAPLASGKTRVCHRIGDMGGGTFSSVTELARAVRERDVSSEELVKLHLARIEGVNPRLNAVVTLAPDAALAEARRADEEGAHGAHRGPLHGVPMTIKDSLATAGIVTTAGTPGLRTHVPDDDATVVARLRAAGAILLGKTNTPEITLRFITDNAVYGRTNNPHALERMPGGSSGGAASIVAAGGSPFDIGTDTGGSIRVPSHFCGVAGLKPTAYRVPRTGHIPGLELAMLADLTQVGPIARKVEDLELLLGVLAGVDFRDPDVIPMPLPPSSSVRIESLRAAVYTDNGVTPPTEDTARVILAAAQHLSEAGVRLESARLPGAEHASELWMKLTTSDGGATVARYLESLGTKTMHPFLEWTQRGQDVPTSTYAKTLAEWKAFRRDGLRFLESYDVILCPVNATPAPRHGEPTPFNYTYAYNLLGWPVVVVRCGESAEGLPIGGQIVAHPWREDVALAVARLLESAFGGFRPPKGLDA